MDGTVSGLYPLSFWALKMLNHCVLLPEYEFYFVTYVVEVANGQNWLRIVFIVGLGTEDV